MYYIGTTNLLYRYASHHTVSKKCPCNNATEKLYNNNFNLQVTSYI